MLKRFFATLKPRIVPNWLTKKLESEFAKLPKDAPLVGNRQIAKNANKIYQELQSKSDEGCDDSKNLIEGITDFRKPEFTALPLTNAPTKDARIAEYFSRIIAAIFNPKLRLAAKLFSIERKSKISEIPPHSDGSRTRHELLLTQISGIISDGTVCTYVMDAKDLHELLSTKSQEILKEPMFGYISENLVGQVNKSLLPLNLPIFYKGSDDSININLFHDSRQLLQYDEAKTSFAAGEIDAAIDEIHKAVSTLLREGKIEKFYVKEGEVLNIKNKASLHGVINESGLFDLKATFDPQEPITNKTHRGVLVVSHENPVASPKSPKFINLKPDEKTKDFR